MLFIVAASDDQWNALTGARPGVEWQRVNDADMFGNYTAADAFFYLADDELPVALTSLQKPVFINSVVQTLAELECPANIYRINGWTGFLNRSAWEIAGAPDPAIDSMFASLTIQLHWVKDEPGFIAARVIAMIINEAYFAIEDKVSSKAEIDTAMKLGTNYPHGPFEWAALIGAEHILALLQKLYATDSRYKPSALLIQEVKG